MKLAIAQAFDAAPAQVFAALTDPAVLQRSIEGCEKMVKTGEDAYDVHLKVGIAGFKGSYTGKVRMSEKQPPESFTLAIEGKGAPGFLKATVRLRLAAAGARTELTGEADATVGGVIAAVGSRLIEAAAKRMTADFFGRIAAELTSPRAS